MKTKDHQTKPKLILIPPTALLASLLLWVPAHATAQVVIEGGPAEVQISDQDGKPEAPSPGVTTTVTAEVPPAVAPPREGALTVQPVPNSPITVRVPLENDPDLSTNDAEAEVVTAAAVVVPPKREIEPERAKALAEYERDLNIEKSALLAQIVFRADQMFESEGMGIEATAEPTLKKFSDYLTLLEGERIRVTYHFVGDEESISEARAKSLAAVEWFSQDPRLASYPMTIEQPEVVKTPLPSVDLANEFGGEPYAYLQIVVER